MHKITQTPVQKLSSIKHFQAWEDSWDNHMKNYFSFILLRWVWKESSGKCVENGSMDFNCVEEKMFKMKFKYVRLKPNSVPTIDKNYFIYRTSWVNFAENVFIPLLFFSNITVFLNLNKQSFQAESNIKVPVN